MAVTLSDGRVVRNLTQDEYAATYAEGTPEEIPSDQLEVAELFADAIQPRDPVDPTDLGPAPVVGEVDDAGQS
jgi:hypothetical protein